MSYVDNNLMPGEKIIYRSQLHWIVFATPIVLTALAILAFVSIFSSDGSTDAVAGNIILLTFLLPIAGVLALGRFITWKTSEFAVTNQRVIIKVGWIRRNTLEVLLKKVEGISVDQGILGRILGYGNITVSGTGGAKSPFRHINDPLMFRNKVNTLVAEADA